MPHFHDAAEGTRTVQVNEEAVLPRSLEGTTARAFGMSSHSPRYGHCRHKWCQWNTSVLLVPCCQMSTETPLLMSVFCSSCKGVAT